LFETFYRVLKSGLRSYCDVSGFNA